MSALESALAELRSAATTSTLPHLSTTQSAALLAEIDRLTADLAEARRQVQSACCGPWHDREVSDTDAAKFPWERVRAAREVAGRWHAHAYREATKGPYEATVTWAVAQTVLSLVLAELDYDGIEARDEQETDPEPDPELGEHGTCAAPVGRGAEGTGVCGHEIALREERTTLMADGTDGHGQPGGRLVRVWRHTDVALDYMHRAQIGGPA